MNIIKFGSQYTHTFWKWLLASGPIVIKGGEVVIELGRTIRDSIKKPDKPKSG